MYSHRSPYNESLDADAYHAQHAGVRAASPSDRAVLLHAFVLHAAIAMLYRAMRFGSLSRALARRYPLRVTGDTRPGADAESLVDRAVATTAVFCPFGSTCLTRALTAQCLLRGRGSDAVLRFGVQPGTGPELLAHAWLEFPGGAHADLPAISNYLALD